MKNKLTLLWAGMAAASLAQFAQAKVALDPQAIDLEPFRLIPSLVTDLRQDSNIYGLSTDEVSSSVLLVQPSLNLIAQDRDNVYSARYSLKSGTYTEDEANYLDNIFSVNAHIEPTGRFRFDLGAGYSLLHDDLGKGYTDGYNKAQIEAWGSPDTYDLATISGGVEYGAADAAGQIALNLGYDQKRYDRLQPAVAQDLDTLNGALEFRLRILPKTKLLLDLEHSKGDYSYTQTAKVSDYTENRYLVGVTWDSSANTTGKVRVGTAKRDKASGDSPSKFNWDAGVVWTPMDRTRFTLDGFERFSDGTFPTTTIDSRSLVLGWTHDWSERWQTVANAGIGKDDHDVVSGYPGRQDDFLTYGLAVNYQMRRWLVLGAGASVNNRDSTQDRYDYDRTIFSLNAQLSL